MDTTSSVILHNLDNNWIYYSLYFVFFSAFTIAIISNKLSIFKNYYLLINNINDKFLKKLSTKFSSLGFFVSIFCIYILINYKLNLISAFIIFPSLLLLVSDKYKTINFVFVLFILSTLLILSGTKNFLIVILFLFPIFYIYKFEGSKKAFIFLFILLFQFHHLNLGEYFIHDLFHNSEFFLGAVNSKLDLFKIHSNLGLLEEYLPVSICFIIKKLSFGEITVSLAQAQSLIIIYCLFLIFTNLKKNKLIFIFSSLLAITVHRTSLIVILTFVTIFFLQPPKKKLNYFDYTGLILIPLLCLSTTPTYFLIILLSVYKFFTNNLKIFNKKTFFIIILSWSAILLIFKNSFLHYFYTYYSFSKSILGDQFNYKLFSSNIFVNIIFLFILIFTLSIFLKLERKKNKIIGTILLFLTLLIFLKINFPYSFTRIEPLNWFWGARFSMSSLVPILFIIAIANFKFEKLITLFFIIFLILFKNLSLTQNANNYSKIKNNFINLSFKSNFVIPNNEVLDKVKIINEFTSKEKIMIYSIEPTIQFFLENSYLTKFTTPFIDITDFTSNKNIESFEKINPKYIYFGESFLIFDGNDSRSRAPKTFRYLEERYDLIIYKNLLFGAKKNNISSSKDNLVFSDFDLHLSSSYYSRNLKKFNSQNFNMIYLNCEKKLPGKYKIINELNFFKADLNCGQNFIPKIYFIGKNIELVKI